MFTAILVSLALAAAPQAHPPETLALPVDWYPESLAVGSDGIIYVGSWRQGAVVRLRAPDWAPEPFVAPGAGGLSNTQGLLVDERRGLLWACSGDVGHALVPATPSALKAFRISDGQPVLDLPMPDEGYCNDIALGRDGFVYVTDTFHPRILRWRPDAGALEIWLDSPHLESEGRFQLNGIARLESAFFVSPVVAADYIFRIDTGPEGRPTAVSRVRAPRILRNTDAIRALPDGRLLLFESNAFGEGPWGGRISVARVEGDAITELKEVRAGLNDPSSGIIVGDAVYFVESKYSLLLRHPVPAEIPAQVPFDLQSVRLPIQTDPGARPSAMAGSGGR